MKKNPFLVKSNLKQIQANIQKFAMSDVYVGVPADKNDRQSNFTGESDEITNAEIAYTNDNGSPAKNIPARPFMRPGIKKVREKIAQRMGRGIKDILNTGQDADVSLMAVGLMAQSAIRGIINAGIAPALSEQTLRQRVESKHGAKGAQAELDARAAGAPPSMDYAKPLVWSGQLRNSINFVIRRRGKI